MIKLRSLFFAVFSVIFALFLNGCSQYAILNPKGIIAADEKHLLIIATELMLLVVVPVIFMTFFIAWRYRASNQKAVYAPEWSHSTALEIVWWTIPCIIIAILGVITWVSTHRLDPYKPLAVKGKPITIEAIALEWKWLFIYPDQNIATVNYVQIPVNVPVQFLITSDAPMNSFQIPQLAGQIYAMAGMQTKLNLMATQMGDYKGLSTNYSGEGFSNMGFTTHVSSTQDFDRWVQKVRHDPKKLTETAYNELVKPSTENKVEYFSSANKDLFSTVMMKFMMPMPASTEQSST